MLLNGGSAQTVHLRTDARWKWIQLLPPVLPAMSRHEQAIILYKLLLWHSKYTYILLALGFAAPLLILPIILLLLLLLLLLGLLWLLLPLLLYV
jgi:hypothetical protein